MRQPSWASHSPVLLVAQALFVLTERRPVGPRWREYLRPHRGLLAVVSIVTLLETALDLLAPWPLKLLVDNVVGGGRPPPWLSPVVGTGWLRIAITAGLATVLITAASAVCTYVAVRFVRVAGERIAGTLRERVFTRLLELDLRFHEGHRSSELVTRLTGDVTRVEEALTAWADVLVPQTLTLLGMALVLFVVSPPLAIVSALVAPPLAGLTVARRRRVQRAEQGARSEVGVLAAYMGDVLGNIRAVTAFSEQRRSRTRFQALNSSVTRAAEHASVVEARFTPVADVILAAGTGSVLCVGAVQVKAGHLTLGTLLVLLTYVGLMYAPIRSLARLGSVFARGAAGRQRLAEVLDSPHVLPAPSLPLRIPSSGRCGLPIEFRGVSFRYERDRPILSGLDLLIPSGQFVCLVGRSGAGKTTLLSLAVRLYDPDLGSVHIGGVDVRDCAIEDVRSRMALVPQDTWLLDASLLDNVRWGSPHATAEQVHATLLMCGLGPLVARLPGGLDSQLGDRGHRLSGGERRRLAIARALLRDCPILLLDEPMSGLDAHSEAQVADTLRLVGRDRTVVMVTHQMSLARTADLVVVINEGVVAETGAPQQLLAAGGPFRELCDQQDTKALLV